MKKILSTLIFLLFVVSSAFGQANGKLQIHFIDVGQGDGATLISPKGETVMFDNGIVGHCDLPISYLQQIGSQRLITTLQAITMTIISAVHLKSWEPFR